MNVSRIVALLMIGSMCAMGCGKKADPEGDAMGPAPTGPPSGSPYTASAVKPGISPGAFVAKLQSLPKSERSDYLAKNQDAVNAVMALPEDSADRQKFTAIINQH